MIAESEGAFVSEGIACGVRADGRARDELRAIRVTPRVTPMANGSARVRLGVLGVPGEYTDVIAAVKAELCQTTSCVPASKHSISAHAHNSKREETRLHTLNAMESTATKTSDFLHFGAQMQNSAEYLVGDAADAAALEIAQAMARLIGSACCVEGSPITAQLAVSDVVHWELHIDALVLDCSGGNVFDAVALAIKAALATTKLPMLDVVEGEVEGTYDVELATDTARLPEEAAPKVCELKTTPLFLCFPA